MPVAVSMPCEIGRWPGFAFGVLGESNTCLFRDPPCTSHRSMRLFLEGRLRAGNDPLVPRLVFGKVEDPPLHPELPFAVSPSAILPLFGLEIAQMLKHQDGSPVLLGKLDNASAHQMGNLLVHGADLTPQGDIVLFVFCHDASL